MIADTLPDLLIVEGKLIGHDFFGSLDTTIAGERNSCANKCEQNDPKAPDVGLEVARLILYYLWRHEANGASPLLNKFIFL